MENKTIPIIHVTEIIKVLTYKGKILKEKNHKHKYTTLNSEEWTLKVNHVFSKQNEITPLYIIDEYLRIDN